MRLCESLQNGWSGDRHPARKPDDYAKEAKIAVDKGFDAVSYTHLLTLVTRKRVYIFFE